ncbi:MAG: M28 family peptidase [Marmoricola sp.]
MVRFPAVLLTASTLALTACGPGPTPDARPGPPPTPTATRAAPSPSPSASTAEPPASPSPRADPDTVRPATAMGAVRHLAGRVGPRPGTSEAYFRAAGWVTQRLTSLGWEVRRQPFRTPGGVSWGVPVRGGRSVNLVATRGDVRPGRPWLAVGAHLDTVPQAPGAEDNASGVGVLLTVAEAVGNARTRLPVVLVAFGSEEPRGPGDDDHHYGSRAFVRDLSPAQRSSLRGMVALDRVGVGQSVPVSSARGPDPLRAELLRAARRAGVPADPMTDDRASDHWSFVRAGLPGVRLGSTPYAGYHSAADVPAVVDRAQLQRTARTVVAWLARR